MARPLPPTDRRPNLAADLSPYLHQTPRDRLIDACVNGFSAAIVTTGAVLVLFPAIAAFFERTP